MEESGKEGYMEESGKEGYMEESGKEGYMEESKGRPTPSTSAERVDLEDFTAAVLRGVLRATEARGSAEGATEALEEPTGPRFPGDDPFYPIPPFVFGMVFEKRWPPRREPPEQ